jgi:hypothetical protein
MRRAVTCLMRTLLAVCRDRGPLRSARSSVSFAMDCILRTARSGLSSMSRRLALVVILTPSVAACGGSGTPTAPIVTTASVLPAVGSWSGSIIDGASGQGTLQMTLSEHSSGGNVNSLIGTWSATFKNGDSFSGPASAGSSVVGLAVQPIPACAGTGTGSAAINFNLIEVTVTSSQLTAVVDRLSCNGTSLGSVNLSKH